MSWFDKIPASVRHWAIGLIALVAAGLLDYVNQHWTEWQIPGVVQAAAAPLIALIPVAIMALTTLSRQYGVGAVADGPAAIVGEHEVLVTPSDAATPTDQLPPAPTAGGQDG